jgi:6-phosphogluconolactonase
MIIHLLAGSDGPDGIHLLAFDPASGGLTLVRPLPGAADASFLAFDPATRTLFVADHEQTRVAAFGLAPGRTGLSPAGWQPSAASSTCYVALSPDGRHVASASYGADRAVIIARDADGALLPGGQVLGGTGNPAPGHAHWVQWSPEGDRLYVVDLGHDEVRAYPWDAATGRAGPPVTAFRTPQGHGPRHLAFHPDGRRAYLLTEHGNTLVALDRLPDGTLREIATVPSLAPGYEGKAQAAHIQISPDGTLVYVSNRGPNTIGVFRIVGDGSVSEVQQVPTGGDWPRFFLLLGRHLLVCHQRSNTIVVFDVAADGTLAPNGHSLALTAPVMLLPVPAA